MEGLHFIETAFLEEHHMLPLIQLWNKEYPINLEHKNINDFNKYLENLKSQRHILVFDEMRNLIGWACAFDRENERWFVLILSASVQGKGLGKLFVNKLKAKEKELNGWVIDQNIYEKQNGDKYNSPLEFYRKTGFCILHDRRLELEHLSAVKIRWTAF
jgi:hypothetical protein